MKTKLKFKADLYRTAKLYNIIAIAMYVVFCIGFLVGIIGLIQGNENYFDIATKVIGYLFHAVFCVVTLYYFFFPLNIDKEIERLQKQLKTSRKDYTFFTEMSSKECNYFNDKKRYYRKAVKAEQRVWKLEWELEQLNN